MQKIKAFSLLEIVIVLLISGILVLIAIPAYQNHVRKTRRTEGIHAIYALRLAEEKYRATSSTYGTLAQVQNLAGVPLSSHYAYFITNNSASGYTITANALGDQVNDTANGTSCSILTFTINNTAETKTPAICWQ
jgi:type IV pilus assembly protein PilE